MLIGELAEQTGTSERLLRYYERVGLLEPERTANGYRSYDSAAQATVLRIRALLAAGLPTRVIRRLLPCTEPGGMVLPCAGTLDLMRDQLETLDRKASDLVTARTMLSQVIAHTEALHEVPDLAQSVETADR